MDSLERLAIKLASRFLSAEEGSSYASVVNTRLRQLGQEAGVAIAHDAPLFQIAMRGAIHAGFRGPDAEDAALTVIADLTTRGHGTGSADFSEYTADYIKRTLLAGFIQLLKRKKRLSLSQIRKHPKVQELLKLVGGVRELTLQRYYDSDRSHKNLKSLEDILNGTKSRPAVFEAWMKSGGNSTFEAFWRKVTENAARDLARSFRTKHDFITKSLRFDPTDEDAIDAERFVPLSIAPEQDRLETKQLARRLRHELERLNPDYILLINAIKDQGLDPTNPTHAKKLMSVLMFSDRVRYQSFVKHFLGDLARVLKKLDIDTFQGAEQVLKVAASKRPRTLWSELYELAGWLDRLAAIA